MPFLPDTDIVGVAFISTVPGIDANRVNTTLPKDQAVIENGFTQVVGTGGVPGMYVPLDQSVVTVSCWAIKVGSGKPPWGQANQLAAIIKQECLNHAAFPRTLDLTGFGDYFPARLHTAYFTNTPRRIPSDEGSYARYDGDLVLNWTPLTN